MKEKRLTGYPSIDKPHERDAKYFEKHPIIPSVDIATILKLLSLKSRDNKAINCDKLTATYQNLFDDAEILVRAFKELGVKKGDIVTISLPSNYQAIITFIALNQIGAITTFVNTSMGKENLTEYLNLYNSPVLVNYNTNREDNEYIKKNSHVRHIVTLSKQLTDDRMIDTDYYTNHSDEFINFHTLGSIASFQRPELILPNKGKDDALILYTSGSTGNPKSVLLTNENILAAEMLAGNTSHTENITGTKTLTCVPFSYPYGLVTSALTSLLWGKEAILAPFINNSNVAYYYGKQPNIIFGSPAFLDLTTKNIPEDQDLSFVTHFISGGDFLYPKDYQKGQEFFASHGAHNVEIGNGFGNAETVSIASTPVGVPLKEGTSGRLLVGLDAIIIDPETHKEKKYNEEGLLLVKGKSVFKGYYSNPELTASTKITVNGKEYFNTGTLGYIDQDGYFTVTGRASRFYIMTSLNKVYLDALQSVVLTFEEVKSCAVVQVPDEENRFVSKCYIVLEEGYEPSEELKELIKDKCYLPAKDVNGQFVQLKEYEVPSYIEFVDELPRIQDSEKIDYKKLEQMASEEPGMKLKLKK